jgi:hypothetical protein
MINGAIATKLGGGGRAVMQLGGFESVQRRPAFVEDGQAKFKVAAL